MGLLFTVNTTFADLPRRAAVETVTVFGNCSSSHNQAFRSIQNILYQEDFEIQQELVYEPCGISCYQKRQRRQCYDNTYLQDKLSPDYDNQQLNRSLDPRCTYRALKIAQNSSGHFLDCDSFNDPQPKKRRRSERPCFSKRLHHAIHQSITEISACFRVDPKLFFSLIVNESKGHPLAKNPSSTATGVGQIVSTYVDNYSNQSHITFDTLKNEVLPSLSRQNRNCRVVQDKVSRLSKLEERPICQRTNHYVNMIYAMMGLMDAMSRLTPMVIEAQGKSFEIPQNSPFQTLIDRYEDDLDEEKAKRIRIRNNLRDARQGDAGFRIRGPLEQRRGRIRQMESDLRDNNSNRRNLAGKGRFFRNLARFQGLDANDKKLVSELSLYWYMLPRTKSLFQTYADDRGSLAFEEFTGPNGQWIKFLSIEEVRRKIGTGKRQQDHFIGYVYNPRETSSGSSSIMRGTLNHLEQQPPRIPYRCRPY